MMTDGSGKQKLAQIGGSILNAQVMKHLSRYIKLQNFDSIF